MEVCDLGNEVDEDCDGLIDDGSALGATAWYLDDDVDGYGAGAVSLGCAVDTSVASPERVGYSATNDDCDDSDDAIHPSSPEYCNGVDDDCDGQVDPSDSVDAGVVYVDDDLDGFGREDSAAVDACGVPAGFSDVNTDCDDSDAVVNPGAQELCDAAEVDEDCDGLQNESSLTDVRGVSPGGGDSYFLDNDGDGYGPDDSEAVACSASSVSDETTALYVLGAGDCDEDSEYVNPGAADICNGVDDDCDGDIDGEGGVGLLRGAGQQGYDVTYCFDANQTYSDETATAVLTAVTVAGEDSQGAVAGDELTCTALYDAANTDTVTFSWSGSSSGGTVVEVSSGQEQGTYPTTSDDEGTEVICTVTLTTNAAVPEEISGSATIYVSDTDELACTNVMSPNADTATYTYSFCPSFKASPDTSADEPYYSERDWYGNLDIQSGTIVLAKPDFDSSSLKEDWSKATVTLNGEGGDSTVSISSTTGVDLTISNLTLSGTNSTTDLGGGGLFCSGVGGPSLPPSHNVTLLNAGFNDCSGYNGGAIYLSTCGLVIGNNDEDSTFITGNTASNNGGGIYATSWAAITMKGGEVSGNRAYDHGGGIYASYSSVDISGGEISGNNTASYGGGGIYASASSVDISGGEISDNIANTSGGGIYVYYGSFVYDSSVDISGGEISGNTADSGGGIFAEGSTFNKSTVVISGGKIWDNTAIDGGGICVHYTEVDLSGGEISANNASNNGGGIGLFGNSDLRMMDDGSITGNSAESQGGGVYVEDLSQLSLAGGSITSNEALNQSHTAYVGGGIHVNHNAGAFPTSYTTNVSSNTVDPNGATHPCPDIFDGKSVVCIP
jgi:predicted outer membrane repeat protein